MLTAISNRHQTVLTNALQHLLSILSQWPARPPGLKFSSGIKLDLGTFSPSDSKHIFRDFRFDETYPYFTEDDFDDYEAYRRACQEAPRNPSIVTANECPGWISSRQDILDINPTKRIVGSMSLRLPSGQHFPRAPVVTELIVRRQYYRWIDPAVFGQLIAESFTSLQHLRHEFATALRSEYQVDEPMLSFVIARLRADYILLLEALPWTLRRLNIFQDCNPAPLRIPFTSNEWMDYYGTLFLRRSQFLEHLSIAFFVDAENSLSSFASSPGSDFRTPTVPDSWPNLRTLSLTSSSLLLKHGPSEKLIGLLELVAKALLRMPKLEMLEIWQGVEGEGCIFRYEDARDQDIDPVIRFMSSSIERLDASMMGRMEQALGPLWGRTPGRHLRFDYQRLHLGDSLSTWYAGLLPYLSYQVLDPVSKYQLQWELELQRDYHI